MFLVEWPVQPGKCLGGQGELEQEDQGLTEVLLNLLLRCEMERAIGSGNLYMRHTMHWLNILKSADSTKSVLGLLSCQNLMNSLC